MLGIPWVLEITEVEAVEEIRTSVYVCKLLSKSDPRFLFFLITDIRNGDISWGIYLFINYYFLRTVKRVGMERVFYPSPLLHFHFGVVFFFFFEKEDIKFYSNKLAKSA